MCFDRFLLAFESRDLSQADKSIKRMFSVPNFFFCLSGLRPERQKNNFYYSSLSLGKKTRFHYFCQLEIDHVTQKPKGTCQSTCGEPKYDFDTF